MNVSLQTNISNQVLELCNFHEWGFYVHIENDGYSASESFTFWYDCKSALHDFIVQLQDLRERNEGVAHMEGEEGEITFTLNRLGHLTVTGKLSRHRQHTLRLQCVIETDQTCLEPLLRIFKRPWLV